MILMMFLFLKVKKKLKIDYSDLEDEINKNIQRIDYVSDQRRS